MKKINIFCPLWKGIIIVFLPIVLFLWSFQIWSFHKDFYLNEFNKYNISSSTDIRMEDLEKITIKLINYLKNEERDIYIQVNIKGEKQEVFGAREKQHMVDVKKLFQRGYIIRNMGLILLLISFIALRKELRNIHKSILYGSIGSLILIFILFLLVQVDFYRYFTKFHEIFFTNDLWLLDPKNDVLIQMLPLEFFEDITIRIIGSYLGFILFLNILFFILNKRGYCIFNRK